MDIKDSRLQPDGKQNQVMETPCTGLLCNRKIKLYLADSSAQVPGIIHAPKS